MKAFLIDYLVISLYLIVLLLLNLLLGQIFGWTYDLRHLQAQWIVTLSSVLPIALFFGILEGAKGTTPGKYIMRIKIDHQEKPFTRSILRNLLKFLPWQLGHMSTIYAIFIGTDIVFYTLLIFSFGLLVLYITTFIVWERPFIDRLTKISMSEMDSYTT